MVTLIRVFPPLPGTSASILPESSINSMILGFTPGAAVDTDSPCKCRGRLANGVVLRVGAAGVGGVCAYALWQTKPTAAASSRGRIRGWVMALRLIFLSLLSTSYQRNFPLDARQYLSLSKKQTKVLTNRLPEG